MKQSSGNEPVFMTPISRKFVDLIERNADELTKNWLRDVKANAGTQTYGKYDEKELYQRAFRVFSQLGKWISQETTKDDIKNYWTDLGKQRREEGFLLSEIVLSVELIRRHLWQKVESEGVMDSVLDLYQALELHNRVMRFFDRAIYYAVIGYET
jgi:hypothetical protein